MNEEIPWTLIFEVAMLAFLSLACCGGLLLYDAIEDRKAERACQTYGEEWHLQVIPMYKSALTVCVDDEGNLREVP